MLRVKDLKNQIGTPYPRPILWCMSCHRTSSANRGDYFLEQPETVLRCCGKPMRLVTEHAILETA